ncbi:uncharacterized protein F4817DRAFT_20346 [Daldinia loculata]|uniref:uncharacterized protein n=1 Tax=Daldinia loculata TaxID=103429 RepID=UPI0020C4A159|nr:uncharacterized protein F4817DRAFT_20346 [Daldinia loculata]KAI1641997.1 hypothetical protein F4817DRAFT_20346 [Daldinia loculata]
MPPTTFRHFSLLPRELRDQIWDAAIRPDVPSVHFFTAWHGTYGPDPPTIVECAVAGRGEHPDELCSLAAPRCNIAEPDRLSWFENNPSVYMEDSGLWTACKESREAMIRRFGNHKVTYQKRLNERASSEYLKPNEETNDASATGTMVQDGKRQYFTVCPKTDLFCLQSLNACGSWETFEKNVPIFNQQGSPKPHIALEFDPMWMNPQTDEQGFKYELAFEATTGELGRWASKLWFIDYRIRPKLDIEDNILQDLDKHTVFQGRGCKYVEVITTMDKYTWTWSKEKWVWDHDKPENPIYEFLHVIQDRQAEYAMNMGYIEPWEEIFTDDPPWDAPEIGVLACIPEKTTLTADCEFHESDNSLT